MERGARSRNSATRSSLLAPATSGSDSEVECAEPVERGGGERGAGDVVDDASKAADVAGGVEQAGLFLAGRAVAEEFHGGGAPVRACASA